MRKPDKGGEDGRELAQYETAIRKAADRENRPEIEGGDPFGLMDEYFDGSLSIQEKVEHGRISVENIGGVLYACTMLILKEELEDWKLAELCEFVSVQYSESWGERFEQRDIPADGGMIRVFIQELQTAGLVQRNSQSKESYLDGKRTAYDNHIPG